MGLGGGYIARALVSVQGFHDKLITDSMGDDAPDRVFPLPVQQVETVTEKSSPD